MCVFSAHMKICTPMQDAHTIIESAHTHTSELVVSPAEMA